MEGQEVRPMIETHGNPKTNCLRAGVKEKELEAAVRTSGYPLQRVVADCILNDLFPTLVGKLRLALRGDIVVTR